MRVPLWCTVVVVSAVVACKEATAPDEPGPPADIAGVWSFSEAIANTQLGVHCGDQGTLAITQSNANLSGAVTQTGGCGAPGDTVVNSGTGSFTGNVGAATIRLSFGDCNYHGDLFDTPRDSANGTVTCSVAVTGGKITLTGTWLAIKGIELAPPSLSAGLIMPAGDTMAVTDETVRLAIHASDDHRLQWVGYRIGPPANLIDSMHVTDSVSVDTIPFIVQGSWDGSSDVAVWATDASNKRTEQPVGHIRILAGIRRPFQSIAFGVHAADGVYDPARNVMYFSEPESARVVLLSLSSFTFGAPIVLPMTERGYLFYGIDIVPGGDTVITPQTDSARLFVLDRVANALGETPVNGARGFAVLRVAANRKVLLGAQVDSAGYIFFAVVSHDLATGSDSVRRDLGGGRAGGTFWDSPDQSKILILNGGCSSIYDAASDAFSGCHDFGYDGTAPASATTHGDMWLVGNHLLDGSLSVVATVPGLASDSHAGMSPDGAFAYVPRLYGYDKVGLPGGVVLERVRVPMSGTRASVFPEGNRLFLWDDGVGTGQVFGFGAYHATVVQLQ